ncbi:DUF3383 domain-containing protein [Laribacter hongkongensis]|uniref:DUF3383 domain-containing protein n=1 Tax=Laribacter hongkongensis TaxID=168471 RepID=UPI001EFC6098|nr:DUF3383 domain-containing protein [Laribacter hongkongensis]MCG9064715.1 DUF3383 domain-containing protein [Laribacter hongkongensis]
MSLPLNLIVNVQLNTQPVSSARRDFGTLALFTPEQGNVFSDAATLYVDCASQGDVETAFGTNSETARASRPFFAQTPRPKSMMVARWVRAERIIPAVKSALSGSPLSNTLADLKAVTDGRLSLAIGASRFDVTGLDLSSVVDLQGVASVIDAKIAAKNVSCRYDAVGNRFIVEADVAGADDATRIGYATDSTGSGTYLGGMLKLEAGQADITAGANAVTLPAETLPEAFARMQDKNPSWYAAVPAAQLGDDEIEAASGWIQAADKKIFGYTTTKASHIEFSQGNVFKTLYDRQAYRTVALYDRDDYYAAMSWLARALSVNFAANNSTLTMKFKDLPGITPDNLTLTEAKKCTRLGINFYTYYDDTAMVAEGTVIGGRFFDEIHILDWFVDAVQKEVFAVLKRSPTKIPLTDAGTARLIAAVKKVAREGVKNGAFAPGIWNGDPFGTLETGDRLDDGFYVWADTVDNLSTSDRESRKAPPLQVAIKLAGAIHGVDIIVNFDR